MSEKPVHRKQQCMSTPVIFLFFTIMKFHNRPVLFYIQEPTGPLSFQNYNQNDVSGVQIYSPLREFQKDVLLLDQEPTALLSMKI